MSEGSQTLRVVGIFGWRKGTTGALVDIYVNDRKLSSGRGADLVSNPAHRGREMWWAASLEVPEGTIITLDVKVGIRGAGRDSDRTCKNRYVVSADYPPKEIRIRKVGFRDFPLLKGPFKILIEQSEQDTTDQRIEGMLEGVDESES
jgi:hypothetical protein